MTMNALAGKIACVTGATSGFGLATARALAAAGSQVIITGRRADRLQALARELGSSALALAFDVRDKAAVMAAFADRQVDILVNNAGLALGALPFEKQAMDDLEQMVETNVLGLIYCTHAVLPGMVERRRGHIVNIGSIAGSYPYPGGNVYGATKAFITQFTLNLRADLLDKNVRVTSIEPGMCDTEFSTVRFHGDKNKADTVYAGMTPLSAQDIAETILWCIARPSHVNINRVEIMPTEQAFSPFAVHRKKG